MTKRAWCQTCLNIHPEGQHTRPQKVDSAAAYVAPEVMVQGAVTLDRLQGRASEPETRKTVVTLTPAGREVAELHEKVATLQAQLAAAEESERRALEDVVRYTARVKTLEERLARIEKLARGET